MFRDAVPPGYQRQQPVKRPSWGRSSVRSRQFRKKTKSPARQRHRAKWIFERMRAEHAFSGCGTIVKNYVRTQRRSQEMFLPLLHTPDEAQADFGEGGWGPPELNKFNQTGPGDRLVGIERYVCDQVSGLFDVMRRYVAGHLKFLSRTLK
jgi:hypothetical protein